jgi:hypothetical protein
MILTAIGIAMVFISFFSLTQVPKWMDFKPFNCGVCLTFWVCVAVSVFNLQTYAEPFAYAGYGAYGSIMLKRLLFKF